MGLVLGMGVRRVGEGTDYLPIDVIPPHQKAVAMAIFDQPLQVSEARVVEQRGSVGRMKAIFGSHPTILPAIVNANSKVT